MPLMLFRPVLANGWYQLAVIFRHFPIIILKKPYLTFETQYHFIGG